MKKSLFLVPAVAFGIFAGVSNEASAQEVDLESPGVDVLDQAISASSVYENAPTIENGKHVKSQTSNTYPVQRYKFYYDGSDGYAAILFHPDGNQKLNVLNGNLIKVNNSYDTSASNLTYGWNYVEIIQTAPGKTSTQPFEFAIGWN
ncbi:hypothetical protein [Lysinibacillus xylanilyticus]|uniref:hypothetical protein n=1 Tax=Lysinibacillus xylanilyticus TaxID=582475 RepID=UPI00083C9AE5|nr:hypothetical protein [Lysinibacillus xylanilyticus]